MNTAAEISKTFKRHLATALVITASGFLLASSTMAETIAPLNETNHTDQANTEKSAEADISKAKAQALHDEAEQRTNAANKKLNEETEICWKKILVNDCLVDIKKSYNTEVKAIRVIEQQAREIDREIRRRELAEKKARQAVSIPEHETNKAEQAAKAAEDQARAQAEADQRQAEQAQKIKERQAEAANEQADRARKQAESVQKQREAEEKARERAAAAEKQRADHAKKMEEHQRKQAEKAEKAAAKAAKKPSAQSPSPLDAP